MLLSTGPIQPLSILELQYLINGQFEPALAVGVAVLILTVGLALVVRLFGLQFGLHGS